MGTLEPGYRARMITRRKTEELSIPAIRRLLLRFEKSIRTNENQRSKYPDDPSRYRNLSPWFWKIADKTKDL